MAIDTAFARARSARTSAPIASPEESHGERDESDEHEHRGGTRDEWGVRREHRTTLNETADRARCGSAQG